MPATTFLLALKLMILTCCVFLKAVESLIILFTELLDTPNLSIDSVNVFITLLEKPGKIYCLPFTTSSVDLNINSDIIFDIASGFLMLEPRHLFLLI